jgi:S-adenosylmethionine:tRNA ribosyltransferase-isomerase
VSDPTPQSLAAFDFALPEELIALRPAVPRDSARLLVVEPDTTHDAGVTDLGRWLRAGDLLVVNDSKVIPAALQGWRAPREGGGSPAPVRIDLNLIADLGGDVWQALGRPARRLRAGDVVAFAAGVDAVVIDVATGGKLSLRLRYHHAHVLEALAEVGAMPLPPYIARKRAADAADLSDYQTTYARAPGSVAAPTAGLHFTPELLEGLKAQGVRMASVTLHVGAGTFLPVKTDTLAEHRMHAEWRTVPTATATAVAETRATGGRIIAVGTTALRALESAASAEGALSTDPGLTDIFITPGYRFRVIDGLMTNFHLPKSTLFMLVAALMGRERMQAAYAHAIAARYRFFSYGDASLLLPARTPHG